MTDQPGMESQLAILRSLRAAADALAQAQNVAEERKLAELAAAQAACDVEEADANAMLSQAEVAHEQGRRTLASVRLGRLLKAADRESEAGSDDDPLGELAREGALAQTLIALQVHVTELRRLRIRRARKRGAIALGFALLVALLIFAVPRLRLEIPYRWGVAMLDQGRWGWAQGSLQSVLVVNPQYKDAQVLLREAYYRPASAALEAGQWAQARLLLRALLQLDLTYRDASTLLQESYWRPIQQAAAADQTMVAAQAIIQWRAFGPSDARISGLLSDNTAIRQAVSELYASLWAQGRVTKPLSFAGSSTAVSSLAVMPEGRRVAVSQEDGNIILVDADTGFPADRFDAQGTAALGYALDGRLYAATVRNRELVYFQPGSADEVSIRWSEAVTLSDILVYPESGLVTASDRNGQVWFWQIQTGESPKDVSGHHPGEVHLTLSLDGQLLASGGADKVVRLWDVTTGAATRILRDQPAAITSIAVAPDKECLAIGGADGAVRLLSLRSFGQVGNFVDRGTDVTALAWHPSGQLLAVGASDGAVALWNPASIDKPVALSQAGSAAVTDLAFSPEGGLLAAGDAAGHVRLWRALPDEGQAFAPLTPTPLPTMTPTPSPTLTPSPTEVPPTRTPTLTPIPEAIVLSKDLNVRSGPGTNYPSVDAVHSGDRLVLLGRNPACDWWLVKLPNGKTGWVSVALVRSTTARCDPPSAPVPTIPPTPTRKPTATPRPTPVPTKTPRPTPVPTKAPWVVLTDSTRDFTGSQGANGWFYLWEGYGGRGSFNWREMPGFDGSCWRTDSQEPDIRICYGGEVHPGWGSNIALLWKSSVDGQVRINTQFRKLDTSCGDGIELAVYKGTGRILPHQWISGNDSRGRSDTVDVQVASGDLIFIVVTIHGDSTCDKSQVNAQILLRQ